MHATAVTPGPSASFNYIYIYVNILRLLLMFTAAACAGMCMCGDVHVCTYDSATLNVPHSRLRRNRSAQAGVMQTW